MTYALPAGPRPAPRRQLMVSTGVAVAAGAMLIGGMFATDAADAASAGGSSRVCLISVRV